MSEIDDINKLRNKLNSCEAESPGFDDIFGDNVLGDASLRNVFQSKLKSFVAFAPSYEALMDKKKPVFVPFTRRMIPFWSVAAAAVAFLAFFFLKPEIANVGEDGISMVKEETNHNNAVQKNNITITIVRPEKKFLTQKLATPQTINKIVISNHNVTSLVSVVAPAEDSTIREELSIIKDSKYNSLTVDEGYSIEEIYAQARESRNNKKEKIKAGLNFNGANRLLAFVNTKDNGSFALKSTLDNYSEGFSSLSASSTPSVAAVLRAAEASINDWAKPSNTEGLNLENYNTSYSLPLNIGLSVSIPILKNLEIQTGISYTYLSGLTSGTNLKLHQELHYLGIPVKLALNIHESGRFKMYASFGGAIEKGLIAKQFSQVEGKRDIRISQEIHGIQPVIGGQLGATYEIAPSILVYVEPGANYYIPNDQPISSRTDEPFNFNLGFGVRYSFK